MKSNKSIKRSSGVKPKQSATVNELKSILENTATAALLSGMNLEVIGDPGFGKTSILHFLGMQVFGLFERGGHYMKIECTPSTRSEKIHGHENPAWMLDPDAEEKGIPYWVVKNTPRDDRVMHVLLNERSRLNEQAMDALLPIMDAELNVFNPVTFFADSNWLPNNPRHAALGDRFTFRVWFTNRVTDIALVMRSRPPKTWQFDVPDTQQISEMREQLAWWRVEGENTNAFSVIEDAINGIAEAIPGSGFTYNPRRIVQWMSILYVMGAYYSGKSDFDDLPAQAFEAWSWAYPTSSPMEQLTWRKMVMANRDPLAAKIANMESEAIKSWNEIYAAINHETRSPQERQQRVSNQIGALLAGYQEILDTEYDNDPRAEAAIQRLSELYKRMWNGQPLEGLGI